MSSVSGVLASPPSAAAAEEEECVVTHLPQRGGLLLSLAAYDSAVAVAAAAAAGRDAAFVPRSPRSRKTDFAEAAGPREGVGPSSWAYSHPEEHRTLRQRIPNRYSAREKERDRRGLCRLSEFEAKEDACWNATKESASIDESKLLRTRTHSHSHTHSLAHSLSASDGH